MADTKKGRDKQAHDQEKRQRKRELQEARDRGDEAEPPLANEDESSDLPQTCHRRGCNEQAAFIVLERYQEETGHGATEAEAYLCRAHTSEEGPTNLDGTYTDYVFRIEVL